MLLNFPYIISCCYWCLAGNICEKFFNIVCNFDVKYVRAQMTCLRKILQKIIFQMLGGQEDNNTICFLDLTNAFCVRKLVQNSWAFQRESIITQDSNWNSSSHLKNWRSMLFKMMSWKQQEYVTIFLEINYLIVICLLISGIYILEWMVASLGQLDHFIPTSEIYKKHELAKV